MDVNVTLAQLRTLTAGCLHTGYGDIAPADRAGWIEEALEALERVAALASIFRNGRTVIFVPDF